ncbi:MAG: porin family protein [Saprospiraceae bacterium]
MKKIQNVLTIAAVLFSATFSFAQISIGAKAGVYTSFIDVTEAAEGLTQNVEGLTTPTYGLVAEINLGENFSFQPELLYTTKGFKVNEGINVNLGGFPIPAGVTASTKINYLEMPLLAKYKFGNEGLRFNITAGPVLSYAANGQLVTRANLLLDINPLKTNIDLDALNYERLEVSASIGAGMAYATSGGEFFADARYIHGFSDLYNAPVVDLNLKNRGIGVTVGYKVNL